MKKKLIAVITTMVSCCLIPLHAFAMELPKYYEFLAESKYERTSRANDYEVGEIFYATTGQGKIYYIVCEGGVAKLCSPDGEIVTYTEVQQYFGNDTEDATEDNTNVNQTDTEGDDIKTETDTEKEKEEVKQENEGKSTDNNNNTESRKNSSGDTTLGRELGDISMGNHPLAPYYGSDIIVPRPAQSKYPPVAKTAGTSSFSDVRGHWAKSYIKRFAAEGFISGDPDGRFRPDDPVSYAEFVSIVARFDLKPVRWQGGFVFSMLFAFGNSMSENEWYYNAVMRASEAGLFGNYSKITMDKGTSWNGQTAYFLPRITELAQRQHIAQFAVNLLEYKESDLNTILNYTDELRINNYSDGVIYNAVKRMVNNNIVTGYPDGSFRPEDTITRAELVVMLTKILDKYQWDMDTISNNMYGNYYLWNWEQDRLLGDLVNEARKNAGITPLETDKDLDAMAAIRIIEKSVYGMNSGGDAHQSQFYGSIQNMADSFGYIGRMGENAHFSRCTANSAHDSLMNSEAHKDNLLTSKYRYGGFAVGEDCAYEMFSWK